MLTVCVLEAHKSLKIPPEKVCAKMSFILEKLHVHSLQGISSLPGTFLDSRHLECNPRFQQKISVFVPCFIASCGLGPTIFFKDGRRLFSDITHSDLNVEMKQVLAIYLKEVLHNRIRYAINGKITKLIPIT